MGLSAPPPPHLKARFPPLSSMTAVSEEGQLSRDASEPLFPSPGRCLSAPSRAGAGTRFGAGGGSSHLLGSPVPRPVAWLVGWGGSERGGRLRARGTSQRASPASTRRATPLGSLGWGAPNQGHKRVRGGHWGVEG